MRQWFPLHTNKDHLTLDANVNMDENYGQVHGEIACLVFGQYFSHLGHIVQYDGSMDRCDDRL